MERAATQSATKPDQDQTAALRFARQAHSGQRRKQNDRPYIEHPMAVAELLTEQGFEGPIVVSAYLHDTVEKTEVAQSEIESHFGPRVAAIVAALSEDGTVESYADRKRALREQALGASRDAVIVYAADRLANMRDWRVLGAEQRDRASDRLGTTFTERLELWAEDLEALTALDAELPFLAELEIELRALRGQPG
jgi:(p)ppGpp synthase/HD superfamily hydrolase